MVGKQRLVAALVTAMMASGTLSGCENLAFEPEPIDRTRHAEDTARTSAHSDEDEIPLEDEPTADRGDDIGSDNDYEATGLAPGDEVLLGNIVDDDEGNDEDATRLAQEDTDESRDQDGHEDESLRDGGSPCLLSFRSDIQAADFSYPQSGTTDSFLPQIVAIGNDGILAIEMEVTYQSTFHANTNEFHNEAVRLADGIRRETVRLIRRGVTKRTNLEDSLMDLFLDGDSLITGIDIYNVFEVEPIVSSEGYVTYVPFEDGEWEE